MLSYAVWASTGQRLRDVTSGYQALSSLALATFADRFPTSIADANVRTLACRAGLKVIEIPVEMHPRLSGASMHDGLPGVRLGLQSLQEVWRERRRG